MVFDNQYFLFAGHIAPNARVDTATQEHTLAGSVLSEDYKPDKLRKNIGEQYLTRRDSFSHSESFPVEIADTTGSP
jgi:hypothetical protein